VSPEASAPTRPRAHGHAPDPLTQQVEVIVSQHAAFPGTLGQLAWHAALVAHVRGHLPASVFPASGGGGGGRQPGNVHPLSAVPLQTPLASQALPLWHCTSAVQLWPSRRERSG
jgi:hypothetical protein